MQRQAESRFHEIYERYRDEVPRQPLPWLYAVARKSSRTTTALPSS